MSTGEDETTNNDLDLTVDKFETGGDTLPLYVESRGEEGPAYLYLDTRDGGVWLSAKHPAHRNTWGPDEHAGHVLKWRVPNNLTRRGYNDLLDDPAILDSLKKITNDSQYQHGHNGDYTEMGESAEDASDALFRYLDDLKFYGGFEALEVRDAREWLELLRYSKCVETGESTEAAALRLSTEAQRAGFFIYSSELERELDRKKLEEEEEEEEEKRSMSKIELEAKRK